MHFGVFKKFTWKNYIRILHIAIFGPKLTLDFLPCIHMHIHHSPKFVLSWPGKVISSFLSLKEARISPDSSQAIDHPISNSVTTTTTAAIAAMRASPPPSPKCSACFFPYKYNINRQLLWQQWGNMRAPQRKTQLQSRMYMSLQPLVDTVQLTVGWKHF